MRVGAVSFLNTLPLAAGLERFLPGAEIVRATPARLAEELDRGTLDVGLVPVAALTVHPEWSVVPGLGIAAEGPVRSVLLLSRTPLERVERVVTDPASRTSNVLARLWLRHRLGRDVPGVPGPARLEERLSGGAATVAIGDDALFWTGEAAERVDLGGAWSEWTGLPFVFAVWAGPGAGDPALAPALHACYRTNAARLDELAQAAAPGDPARAALIGTYLRDSIRYPLGPREREGLQRYLTLGAEAGYLFPAAERSSHVDAS